MTFKQAVIATLALAGTTAAGLAQAQEPRINWSVTIGAPFLLPLPRLPVLVSPVYGVAPAYALSSGYAVSPGYAVVAPPRHAPRRDWDNYGIPNRYDHVYNPRWDRDGDGIPNRYDRNHRQDRHAGWNDGGSGWQDGQRGDRSDDRRDDNPQQPRRGR